MHYLLTPLSEAVKRCPGDARHAIEKPLACTCPAHPWPHMAEVSLRCSRRRFAERQWAERLTQQPKDYAV